MPSFTSRLAAIKEQAAKSAITKKAGGHHRHEDQ
jgi:hypothetical protein